MLNASDFNSTTQIGHGAGTAQTFCFQCSGVGTGGTTGGGTTGGGTTGGGTTSGTSANLVPGWNLVGNSSSGPLNMTGLLSDPAKVNTVWKWISSKGGWAFYTPSTAFTDWGAAYAAGKGYDFLTTVNGGEGFWVNAKTSFTLSLPSGGALSSSSFQMMSAGWNLISVGDSPTPSGFNSALSAFSAPPTPGAAPVVPLNLTTLWAWDAGKGNWYFYAPSLEAKGGTVLVDYITQKGYLDFGTKVLDPVTGFWVNHP